MYLAQLLLSLTEITFPDALAICQRSNYRIVSLLKVKPPYRVNISTRRPQSSELERPRQPVLNVLIATTIWLQMIRGHVNFFKKRLTGV